MFCHDYQHGFNHDNTKKYIDTLRHEFLVGTNAVLYNYNDEWHIKWMDYYPKSKHSAIEDLFKKINEEMKSGLPFLGGMKIIFEIGSPRPDTVKNILKRDILEF